MTPQQVIQPPGMDRHDLASDVLGLSRSIAPITHLARQAGAHIPARCHMDDGHGSAGPHEGGWIDPDKAAAHCGVSTRTIYYACGAGLLRHTRINGKRDIRTRIEWIEEWMNRFVRGGEPPPSARMTPRNSTRAANEEATHNH